MSTIQTEVLNSTTPSGLASIARRAVTSGEDKILLKHLISQRAKDLGVENLSKNIYEYACRIIEFEQPEFEDAIKFYSLFESLRALSEIGLNGASEYEKLLRTKNEETLVKYPLFKTVIQKFSID